MVKAKGAGGAAPAYFAPTASTGPSPVQLDWENRDFTQSIQLGVTQLTAFLNEFGTHACLLHHPPPPLLTGPVTAQMEPCEGAWRS